MRRWGLVVVVRPLLKGGVWWRRAVSAAVCQSFTVFVNFPFILLTSRLLSTQVGCLLATGFLGTKHPFVLLQCWCVSSHFLWF